MRRQDIQLLGLARQGDAAARCEVGRRYLIGADGFPRHVATGLDYLQHPSLRGAQQAARTIADNLPLEELLSLQQETSLMQAATAGSASAQAKLGAWLCVRQGCSDDGLRWLDKAAAAGHAAAARGAAALRRVDADEPVAGLLEALAEAHELDALQVSLIAAREAEAQACLPRLAAALRLALALVPSATGEIAERIAAAVLLAEREGRASVGIDAIAIEPALDLRTARGDRDAAHALGRALCGIPCGAIAPERIVTGQNLRKGVALLLRAADGGCEGAWLHLYAMHGDHRLSVANPQMARFCLEKAARGGQTVAQRKLGALLLRAADGIDDSEAAIEWLSRAARAQDAHAKRLLQSLVLPLEGSDAGAETAIALVRRDEPWLAMRLQLARHFGLTKLEALCVDPADGWREWGLVVGRNPFISQIRLSAARAVPSMSEAATEAARGAAAFFGQAREVQSLEGDLRKRSLRQRRAFERHGLDESTFFAQASSTTLEALRLGPKWAFRAREPLQLALAA